MKNRFLIKDSLPKDVPAQSGVLACGFPITLWGTDPKVTLIAF